MKLQPEVVVVHSKLSALKTAILLCNKRNTQTANVNKNQNVCQEADMSFFSSFFLPFAHMDPSCYFYGFSNLKASKVGERNQFSQVLGFPSFLACFI